MRNGYDQRFRYAESSIKLDGYHPMGCLFDEGEVFEDESGDCKSLAVLVKVSFVRFIVNLHRMT